MKLKKLHVLALAGALTAGTVIGASASGINEYINVLLNRELTIAYNGEVQTMEDANGLVVYPISYNGTTYLPARAVSDMMGIDVAYDPDTNTVLLGETEAQPVSLVTRDNTGGTEFSWIIADKSELSIAGSDATQPYQNGIQWHIWNGTMSTNKNRVMYFDVEGYSEVSFTMWCDIEAAVKIYDQDYNVITKLESTPDALESKTISIPAGVTKIAFGADVPSIMSDDDEGTLKILDAVIQ